MALVNYSQLQNENGTIINPITGKRYSSPIELATDLGILPHEIDWAKISSAPSPAPALAPQPTLAPILAPTPAPVPTQSQVQPQSESPASQTLGAGGVQQPTQRTLIDIVQSRPDVLRTAQSLGGDPFQAGTPANVWLNDWWNTAGKNEYSGVQLAQPVQAPTTTSGRLVQARGGQQVAEVVPGGLRGIESPTDPRFQELGGFGATEQIEPEEFEQLRLGQQEELVKEGQEFGIDDLESKIQRRPEKTFEQLYQEVYTNLGLEDIKNNLAQAQTRLIKIDDDYATAVGDININPWISEAGRVGRIAKVTQQYNLSRSSAMDELTFLTNTLERGRDDARSFAKDVLDAFHEEREFDLDTLKILEERAEKDLIARGKFISERIGGFEVLRDSQGNVVSTRVVSGGIPSSEKPSDIPVPSKPIQTFDQFIEEKQQQLQQSIAFPERYRAEYEQKINEIPDTPEYYLSLLENSRGKKTVDVDTRRRLSKYNQVVGGVQNLSESLKDIESGPILGILRSRNPYDVQAQLIQAQLIATIPALARGIYGEVGVLTDTDIATYAKTLPNIKQTAEARKLILAMTIRSLMRAYENDIEVSAGTGLDVSGLKNNYLRVKQQVESIEKQLGVNANTDFLEQKGL